MYFSPIVKCVSLKLKSAGQSDRWDGGGRGGGCGGGCGGGGGGGGGCSRQVGETLGGNDRPVKSDHSAISISFACFKYLNITRTRFLLGAGQCLVYDRENRNK